MLDIFNGLTDSANSRQHSLTNHFFSCRSLGSHDFICVVLLKEIKNEDEVEKAGVITVGSICMWACESK